jgi:hypothetical protein
MPQRNGRRHLRLQAPLVSQYHADALYSVAFAAGQRACQADEAMQSRRLGDQILSLSNDLRADGTDPEVILRAVVDLALAAVVLNAPDAAIELCNALGIGGPL